ncbi:enhancer of split m8 protein-like [Cochliomyia hominivorax]
MSNMEYATKTEIYQKIKKPLLERQRRARINKCLDGMKQLMVDLNGNSKILRMDKAEMLETTIVYLRKHVKQQKQQQQQQKTQQIPMDSYRNGYMNAVNEVSRVLASTPGMIIEMGKSIMSHLGHSYKRLQQEHEQREQQQQQMQPLTIDCPLSPASSGYHSDDNDSPAVSPVATPAPLWRPW